MAFPKVESYVFTESDATANPYLINIPKCRKDEVILVIISTDNNGTNNSLTEPTGWIERVDAYTITSPTIHVIQKFATGDDGDTVSVSFNAPTALCAIALRISNAFILRFGSGGNTGTSTAPDSGGVSPAMHSAKDVKWLAVASFENDSSQTVSSFPTNYTEVAQTANAGNVSLAIGEYDLNAADQNPGAYTLSASAKWRALTIGVSGEPTTVTDTGGGGDFTGVGGLEGALGDADTIRGDIIEIQGTWSVADTTVCDTQDDDIWIRTDSDARHNGWYNTSDDHYRLEVTGAHAITVQDFRTTIDGLAISQDEDTGTSHEGIRVAINSTTQPTKIKNTIIRATNAQTNQDGIHASLNSALIELENVIIYGFARGGVYLQAYTGAYTQQLDMAGCTIFGNGQLNETDSGNISTYTNGSSTFIVNAHSCIVMDPGNGNDWETSGTVTWNLDYIIDSDASTSFSDSGTVGSLENRTGTDSDTPGAGDWVVFNDITGVTTFDLRLKQNAENDAIHMHSAEVGGGLTLPETDLVGGVRTLPYDCGAHAITDVQGSNKKYNVLGGPIYEETGDRKVHAHLRIIEETIPQPAPDTQFPYHQIKQRQKFWKTLLTM